MKTAKQENSKCEELNIKECHKKQRFKSLCIPRASVAAKLNIMFTFLVSSALSIVVTKVRLTNFRKLQGDTERDVKKKRH